MELLASLLSPDPTLAAANVAANGLNTSTAPQLFDSVFATFTALTPTTVGPSGSSSAILVSADVFQTQGSGEDLNLQSLLSQVRFESHTDSRSSNLSPALFVTPSEVSDETPTALSTPEADTLPFAHTVAAAGKDFGTDVVDEFGLPEALSDKPAKPTSSIIPLDNAAVSQAIVFHQLGTLQLQSLTAPAVRLNNVATLQQTTLRYESDPFEDVTEDVPQPTTDLHSIQYFQTIGLAALAYQSNNGVDSATQAPDSDLSSDGFGAGAQETTGTHPTVSLAPNESSGPPADVLNSPQSPDLVVRTEQDLSRNADNELSAGTNATPVVQDTFAQAFFVNTATTVLRQPGKITPQTSADLDNAAGKEALPRDEDAALQLSDAQQGGDAVEDRSTQQSAVLPDLEGSKTNERQTQQARPEKTPGEQLLNAFRNAVRNSPVVNEILSDDSFSDDFVDLTPSVRIAETDFSPQPAFVEPLLPNSPSGPGNSFEGTNTPQTLTTQMLTALTRQLASVNQPDPNTITLRLDPPELGEIEVEFRRENDGVRVRVEAKDAVTMEMLVSRGSEIERLLRQQDFDISRVEFNRTDERSGPEGQRNSNSRDQQQDAWKEEQQRSQDILRRMNQQSFADSNQTERTVGRRIRA